MLKFNRYPPREPGDVELTTEAQRIMMIRRSLSGDAGDKKRDVIFNAYGESIGRTVVASLMDSCAVRAEDAAYEIIQPVFAAVNKLSGGDAGRAFQSGFNLATISENAVSYRGVKE